MGRLSSVAGLALISHENHEASHRHLPALRARLLEAEVVVVVVGIVAVAVDVVGSPEEGARERLLMRLNASVCLTFVGR